MAILNNVNASSERVPPRLSQNQCLTNCTAKFMDLGPNFDLTVDVDAVTIKMKARINTTTMQIIIPSFEVVHVG